jgi:DNA-binding NarL/FixJ family response regulator
VKSVINSANAYECAILDIDLPDGNGVSLAEHLLNQHRACCIVFFTATYEPNILARANQLGHVVNKSDGTHRLLEVIDELQRTTRCPHDKRVQKVEARSLVG